MKTFVNRPTRVTEAKLLAEAMKKGGRLEEGQLITVKRKGGAGWIWVATFEKQKRGFRLYRCEQMHSR